MKGHCLADWNAFEKGQRSEIGLVNNHSKTSSWSSKTQLIRAEKFNLKLRVCACVCVCVRARFWSVKAFLLEKYVYVYFGRVPRSTVWQSQYYKNVRAGLMNSPELLYAHLSSKKGKSTSLPRRLTDPKLSRVSLKKIEILWGCVRMLSWVFFKVIM